MISDLERVVSPWGAPVVVLETIDSTNEEARRRGAAGAPAGLVVLADTQTAGRGRRGRGWHSPAGAGVCCSVLLRPEAPAAEVATLPLRAGLATWRTVRSAGLDPVWKWPNDVLLGGRKVAGILVESSSVAGGRVDVAVVGIGLNVADVPMPDGLAETATSLSAALGRPLDRAEVASKLLAELEGALAGC